MLTGEQIDNWDRDYVEESEVYVVSTCGPTIGGNVAMFEDEILADTFCKMMNEKNKFSKTSKKDSDGISIPWKMGDGQYHYKKELVNFKKDLFV